MRPLQLRDDQLVRGNSMYGLFLRGGQAAGMAGGGVLYAATSPGVVPLLNAVSSFTRDGGVGDGAVVPGATSDARVGAVFAFVEGRCVVGGSEPGVAGDPSGGGVD